jgi:hypothetical protein
LGDEHPDSAGSLNSLAELLQGQGKLVEAEALSRQCLAIREKISADDWRTFNTRCLLGDILLAQQKYVEAEPLLLSGYEGMKQREDRIPSDSKPLLKSTLQRLVQLYDATAQSEKAARWKKTLEDLNKSHANP